VKRALPLALATAIAAGACAARGPALATLVLESAGAAALDPAALRALPAGVVRGAAREAGRLLLTLDLSRHARQVRLEIEGACPTTVALDGVMPGAVVRVTVAPWIDVGGPRPQLGFDAPFAIEVKAGCPQARAGRMTWRQIGGRPLRDLHIEEDGFRLRARTLPWPEALGRTPPWGIVPVSPATRGEAILEATWQGRDGGQVRRQLAVAAASRSAGLPTTPPGTRVLLGGAGWRVTTRPPGGKADVVVAAGLASLEPDVAGVWQLTDGGGRSLRLQARRHDEVPLDCGRGGCHEAIAAASASAAMTTVLARALASGAPDAAAAGYPACAIACHATGEPGLDDGGFTSVEGELGRAAGERTAWPELPRPLQRLGGVGCVACHGPAAVPEASARWSILRADVCATCHDAPPRYGHVAAWRETGMARADRDPRAATEPACARCHTTWGFLASQPHGRDSGDRAAGGPPAAPDGRRPPEGIPPVGITCAACHAVHGPSLASAAPGAAPAGAPDGHRPLLRDIEPPALLAPVPASARARSGVCLACHTPELEHAVPSASAAALWLGRGGLDPRSGAPLAGPAPHAQVPGGCVGCHAGGARGLERGATHGFQPAAASCRSCHGGKDLEPDRELRARAERLLATWTAAGSPGGRNLGSPASPPHAALGVVDRSSPTGRAVWNLLLVLEDPAAAVHNPAYASALLASAEAELSARQR
jgi:hypothetical protein